jgi:hypothetical protein
MDLSAASRPRRDLVARWNVSANAGLVEAPVMIGAADLVIDERACDFKAD